MRGIPRTRSVSLVAAVVCAVVLLASEGALAGSVPGGGYKIRARITGALVPGTSITLPRTAPSPTGLPSRQHQIKVLAAVLKNMHKELREVRPDLAGPAGHL